MTSMNTLFARAKLPDTHRRMRNDGKRDSVSRGKCIRVRRTDRVFSYAKSGDAVTYVRSVDYRLGIIALLKGVLRSCSWT